MEYIYAALLLHKLGQSVNEENMTNVIKSTGVQVDESKVKTLLASLQGVDISAELENASVAMAAPASGASAGAGEAKKEEPKEEKPTESAAGLASLFG